MTNEQIFKLIEAAVILAEQKHPNWPNGRHGHSVIREEFKEFEDAVFADDESAAFKEVTQLAAVCVRFMKENAPGAVRIFN